MAIVDVKTIELEHGIHFFLNRFPNSFDTQYGKDLTNVVGVCADRIDVALAQDAHQRCTVCFKKPFGDGFVFTLLRDESAFLLVILWKMHVHFKDGFDAL